MDKQFFRLECYSPSFTLPLFENPVKKIRQASEFWVAFGILFSVSTYFFDFVSNIATAWKYYLLEYHNKASEVRIIKEGERSEFPGIFPAILMLMFLAHTVNALFFSLRLGTNKEVVQCAYFLPFIYFRRLVLLIWRTGTFQGVKDIRNSEVDAIYNILSAALETGPQLILQFHVFSELGYLSLSPNPPKILVLSLGASFLSGAYNGAQAIMIATAKPTVMGRTCIGIAAAWYTVSTLLLRCLAFEVVVEEGFYHNPNSFRYYYVYVFLAVLLPSIVFWALYSTTDAFWKRLFLCLSSAYVSLTLGPLFPMVHHEQQNNKSHRVFLCKFFNICLGHLLLDLIIIGFVCGFHRREWLTPCYLQWANPIDYKNKRLFPPKFFSCFSFKLLLGFSIILSFLSLFVYVLVDLYTESRLDKKSSFPLEEVVTSNSEEVVL